ncbi:MAG: response regulator transcription factor [Verrucomicrobiota bacterium]
MPTALIVEDQELIRELLVSVLLREFEFDEVIEAPDGVKGWELYKQGPYDFYVLDLMVPDLDGLTLAQRILNDDPNARILIFSNECDDYPVREVNRSGILGFVDKKEMSLDVLFAAFNEVIAGHVYYSANVQNVLTRLWADPDAYFKLLSNREFQMIRAIAQGRDYDSIGEEYGISAFTVRRHKHNAMKKLNLGDEASLLRFALDKGIVKHAGGLDWTTVTHKKQ